MKKYHTPYILLISILCLSCGKEDNIIEFELHPNGVTIMCHDRLVGEIGVVNGVEYEVVDRGLLFQRRNEGLDLTKVCVSNVTDMTQLFVDYQFNQPIGNWDVSNVTNMNGMFWLTPFNQSIEHWDVSNVRYMNSMFESSDFNQPIGNWDVSNVTEMGGMFETSQFNQFIDNWDVSNVEKMSYMFGSSQFDQFIGNWDVSNVEDMGGMFRFSNFNQNISGWCVSRFTSEPNDFSTESPLTEQNRPKWGTCPN